MNAMNAIQEELAQSTSGQELHLRTVEAVRYEREGTAKVIECLRENRDRRLYAEMGYPSLFAYIQEALGYSTTAAYERYSVCLLAFRIPEISTAIADGDMSLSVAARLAAHVRREKPDQEHTRELAEAVSGRSVRDAERILAKVATHTVPPQERVIVRTAELSEVRFPADEELLKLLERARELCSEPSMAEVIRWGLKELITKKEKALGLPAKEHNVLEKQRQFRTPRARPAGKKAENSRYIPMKVRKTISERSGGACEYVDPLSGRRCGARFKLQFEHIKPFAWGGRSTVENLRHYCHGHNQLEALREFGRETMGRWIDH